MSAPAERAAGEECGLSYYVYDKQYERARDSMDNAIPRDILDDLRVHMQCHNTHVRELQCLRPADDGTESQLSVVLKHDVATNELCYFTISEGGDFVEERELVFYVRRSSQPKFVDITSPMYDALQFPVRLRLYIWMFVVK